VGVTDAEAFVAAHYEQVRRALSLALRDPQRAEDLTQEAFARAWRRWAEVSTMERPVAWVYVVAMNQARRDLRREHRPMREPLSPHAPDLAGSVATSVSLATALASLPARQRAVVVLRFLADLSTADVADALRCAEGTVKSTLHSALAHLRVEMDEQEDE
jgi:RNA polymerase sigma-70 factor (ECF subfamily)